MTIAKRTTVFCALALAMILSFIAVYAAEPPIQLVVDGKPLTNLPVEPVIENDRILVPMREVFEALGAVVDWKGDTREVYVGYDNTLIILQIDNLIANINGDLSLMDVGPKLIRDKTMIPLRFVAEGLGLTVEWEPEGRVASVYSKEVQISSLQPTSAQPAATQEVSGEAAGMSRNVSDADIPAEEHPTAEIIGIEIPEDGVSAFSVSASSPISKVETFPISDPERIVIDFYNTEMTSARTSWTVESPIVKQVRMAQNQETVTRVVFDLHLPVAYSLSISLDRTQIYLNFEPNTVNEVRFYSDASSDYVDITLDGYSPVDVFHMTNPDRVVIDVPYSIIPDIFSNSVAGHLTSELRTGQFERHTSRIVLVLNKKVQHFVSSAGNTITVKITEATFGNLKYDESTRTITVNKGGQAVQISEIKHRDAYTANKYYLTMPADLSAVIGYGEYLVADGYLRSMLIRNNSEGLTEFVLDTQRVLAVNVTEDENYIYIKLLRPKEAYDKIVIIDPGHGGSAPGAIANGIAEKDLNLSISLKVMELFERDGRVKAYATRLTDVDIPLTDRPAFGNSIGDLFISIHNNAAERNTKPHGTEAYYYNHDFENQLWVTGKVVAETLHRRLIDYLGSYERRVVHENLAVTRESTIPAALLEIGYLTNPEEAAKLSTEEYQWMAAQAIFDGIIEIFEKYTPTRP